MILQNMFAFIMHSVFVAMFLCVMSNEGRADSCSGINVGEYKERLLSLQSEYSQMSERLGPDSLKSNEFLVGREIDSLIQDVGCIDVLSNVISKYCTVSRSDRVEIWRELVVFSNKSLNVFHDNIDSCRKLLQRSVARSNRFDVIAKKAIVVIDSLHGSIPKELR